MTIAFPEALVEGYELLVPVMPNDPKDRHVLAAAIRSGSQVIVTANLRDFPPQALSQFEVEAQSPDAFLLHQSNLDVQLSVQLLRRQAREKSRPPRTLEDVLDRLAISAPMFSTAMGILVGSRPALACALPHGVTKLQAEVDAALLRQGTA
jgi:hypothetical protein